MEKIADPKPVNAFNVVAPAESAKQPHNQWHILCLQKRLRRHETQTARIAYFRVGGITPLAHFNALDKPRMIARNG
jgi:hypothetical protein